MNCCFICTEPTIAIDGEYFVILESCKCVTHRNCISGYIDAELEKGNLEIKCLNSALTTSCAKCKDPLPFEDLLSVMSQAQLDRWNQLSTDRFIAQSNGRIKLCPTPDCGYAFEYDGSHPELNCPNCKKSYCLECKIPYHRGMFCVDYKAE